MYWMTTQDGTREIEIFNKLFDRYHNIHVNRVSSLKQFTEYFNFLCKIQLDHPQGPTISRNNRRLLCFVGPDGPVLHAARVLQAKSADEGKFRESVF